MTRLAGLVHANARWIGRVDPGGIVPVLPVDEFYADVDAGLAKAEAADPALAQPKAVPAPMVPATAKVVCVAANYPSHRAESPNHGEEQPMGRFPVLFGRWASTLVCDGDEIPAPHNERGLDWEGELAAVIGKRCVAASARHAEAAILGFTAFNDLTARRHQGPQFTVGKNADRSGPIGPVLVTADAIGNPYDLSIVTRVNGEVMQDGNTGEMHFRVDAIIAYASECITLEPGDVIATGTPAGVGVYRDPRVFLVPGDFVSVEISGIGKISNTIVTSVAATV
jgi:2-keto-4-pentenoate hydratase/2-oxohepta-3-ene-1,7-dioic acid hydratase in catechol pathway